MAAVKSEESSIEEISCGSGSGAVRATLPPLALPSRDALGRLAESLRRPRRLNPLATLVATRGGVCCALEAPLALPGDVRRLHPENDSGLSLIGVWPPLQAETAPVPLSPPPPLSSGLPGASQGLGGGEQPAIDEGDGGASGPGDGCASRAQVTPVASVAEVGGCSCGRGCSVTWMSSGSAS